MNISMVKMIYLLYLLSLSNLGKNIKSINITKILDRMGIPVNWEDLIKFNK